MKLLGGINMAQGEARVWHWCAPDEYFRCHIDASREILSLSRALPDNSLIYDKLDHAAHGPRSLPPPRLP